MRLKVDQLSEGLHPAEVVVSVKTKTGNEVLSIDSSSVKSDTIDVGWPVGRDHEYFLIELPRETFSGFWRVWVPVTSVFA